MIYGILQKDKDLAKQVRKLDYESRHFIGSAINMFKINFTEFSISIKPTTQKAFDMTLTTCGNSTTKHFTAAEAKGIKGTYKLVHMIVHQDD